MKRNLLPYALCNVFMAAALLAGCTDGSAPPASETMFEAASDSPSIEDAKPSQEEAPAAPMAEEHKEPAELPSEEQPSDEEGDAPLASEAIDSEEPSGEETAQAEEVDSDETGDESTEFVEEQSQHASPPSLPAALDADTPKPAGDIFSFDLDSVLALDYEDLPAHDPPASASDVAAAMDEIAALRNDVARLEQSISALLDTMVARLEDENSQLRRELQRMYALNADAEPDYSPTSIPRQGRDLFEAIHRNVETLRSGSPEDYFEATTAGDTMEPISAVATAEAGAVRYSVVREWGRSPEEAEEMGGDVTSLKGMVCAVPPDTSQEGLLSLGRALRRQFGHYDNINVEVFNDMEIAWRYVEQNISPGDSRLLAISKHPASERDVLVLFDGEESEEIPFEGNASGE